MTSIFSCVCWLYECLLLRNTKISWAWWQAPVIPATGEAEAGESLEPRRRRWQQAKIIALHSSLGDKNETLSQRKKKYYFVSRLPQISSALFLIHFHHYQVTSYIHHRSPVPDTGLRPVRNGAAQWEVGGGQALLPEPRLLSDHQWCYIPTGAGTAL